MSAEDLTKATLREGSPNLLQMALKCVGKQATTDSCSAGERGGTKDNQASSSKPRVLTVHCSAPGSDGSAAGGSSQDPNEPRQGVSHLALVISDDDEFADDPHQIIPTEDVFTLPFLPRQNLKGVQQGLPSTSRGHCILRNLPPRVKQCQAQLYWCIP